MAHTAPCCCCFSNDVRHLILWLTVICSTILFANLTLFNVIVIGDMNDFGRWSQMVEHSSSEKCFAVLVMDFGDIIILITMKSILSDIAFSTQSRTHIFSNYSTYGSLRKPRKIVNEEEALGTTVPVVSGTDLGSTNKSFVENVTDLEQSFLALDNSDGHPLVPEEETTHVISTTSSSTTVPKTIILTRPSVSSDVNPAPTVDIFTSSSEPVIAKDPTVKISDFDDKDASKVSGKLDDRAKGDTAAGDRVELVENKLPEVAASLMEKLMPLFIWVAPGFGMFFGTLISIWLSKPVGVKKVFAVALFICSLATISLGFTLLAKRSIFVCSAIRFLQGLCCGSVLPVVGIMTANWATLKEQFFFIIWSHLFVQLMPMISWPLCIWLINKEFMAPFLLHSAAAAFLGFLWMLFYRDRPQYHPWVNGLELNKIVTGKIKAFENRSLKKNTFSLLVSSLSVWAIWTSFFCYFLVVALLFQYLPIYYHYVLKFQYPTWNVSLPFVPMLIFTFLYPIWLRLSKICRDSVSVGFFNTVSFILSAAGFVFIALSPQGSSASAIALVIILLALVFSFYGFCRSAVFVGRYYTQYIIAYSEIGLAVAFVFVSVLVYFFDNPGSANEWRIIFITVSAIQLAGAAVFLIIGSSQPEEWSKDSWDPSAGRRLINVDQIDYHSEECGFLEMKFSGSGTCKNVARMNQREDSNKRMSKIEWEGRYFSFPVGSGLARPGGVLEHLIWKAVSLDYLNMH
ncbi:unnamed protein product [Enterobius vermicularis]|uniref:MFS domain-containing protein n=1 Tax=Enterobius vermicularis TaxID=51028 RepID=A0A0N4V4Z8_ENTVE|nr:unnamed protein product [Enterobius vermicularis]